MTTRVAQVAGHAWRIGNIRPLVFALLDSAAIGPLRALWEKEAPWQAGKYVERRGGTVHLDGCRLDVSAGIFSTFQRGCLWLSRHEEPERIAVGRFLDPALPVVELGASTGMLSCLINRRLREPAKHVAIEANPALGPVIASNRRLNRCDFTVLHAAIAYDRNAVGFAPGDDHLAGQAQMHGDGGTGVPATTLQEILDRFGFERVTLVCDIEGMEIDLWRNEAETVVNRVAWLIVELHEPISGKEAVDAFIRGLQARGFTLEWERSWTRVFRNTRRTT